MVFLSVVSCNLSREKCRWWQNQLWFGVNIAKASIIVTMRHRLVYKYQPAVPCGLVSLSLLILECDLQSSWNPLVGRYKHTKSKNTSYDTVTEIGCIYIVEGNVWPRRLWSPQMYPKATGPCESAKRLLTVCSIWLDHRTMMNINWYIVWAP